MFSMLTLLSLDPFLPEAARQALAGTPARAHEVLVGLGATECEALELIGAPRGCWSPGLRVGEAASG